MLFINNFSLDCLNAAAVNAHVPAIVILAVLKTEGGRIGLAKANRNASFDYGVMQINSVFLPILSTHGYTLNDLQYDACKNLQAGVWILSKQIANSRYFSYGVGNYHSHAPYLNATYFSKARSNYKKISSALSS